MKQTLQTLCTAVMLCLMLSACEKPFADDGTEPTPSDELSIDFKVTHFEQIPFDDAQYQSRSIPASQVCTRINLAIFNGETKVKTVNQSAEDPNFGTLSVSLAAGSYKVVILAHSCQGNATVTSPEEIKFPNNKVTDTFYYCQDLDLSTSESVDVSLKRAVAKFLLSIEDDMPHNVKEMTFKYTGGSSTFNAVSGYGCVNSRQTETREVTSDMAGRPTQFEVYTFPHDETDELKITVTATDAAANTVAERVFEDVPVRINQITRYAGNFFKETNSKDATALVLTTQSEWTQADYTY